ncbi:DotD/TraH family lipoprotein [Vreelandella rituensis]|nr:SPOR domain-containing protein [Halomonas rituensis]
MKTISASALLIPFAFALSGCGFQQVQAQSTTPIPQSLLQAAERASQSSMIMADIMARAHGQSVDQVKLDLPDSNIPEFLLTRVRLDYNGPMAQVLERVSHDIGYRVVEYNKTPSGPSWQPWIRLNGDKPLVQHFREMNAQTPWHLVLDHRSQRLVVDYDADGSMASQIREAQESLAKEPPVSQRRNMPDTSRMAEDANRQVSQQVIPSPIAPSVQAAPLPATQAAPSVQATQSTLNPVPEAGTGYWYAGIGGYQTSDRAKAMQDWLGAHDYYSLLLERTRDIEVQVPSRDHAQVLDITSVLKDKGVPSEVRYMSVVERNAARPAKATAAPRSAPRPIIQTSQPAQSAITNAAASQKVVSSNTDSSKANFDSRMQADMWYVQVAYLNKQSSIDRVLEEVSSNGYAISDYSLGNNSGKALRVGPYDSREQAIGDLGKLRSAGYPDAYPVKGDRA